MAQRNAEAKRSADKHTDTAVILKFPQPPRRKPKAPDSRDSLPFFRKGTKTRDISWWNVRPSGQWQSDLDTGKEFARAYMPFTQTAGGGPMLGWIVDGMVKAARPQQGSSRVIDGIASGFLMEIANVLQESQLALTFANHAVNNPSSEIARDFKRRFADGTLLFSPSYRMLEIEPPAPEEECWRGIAIGGMHQFDWVYWPAKSGLGRIRVERFSVEPHRPVGTGVFVHEPNVPEDLHRDVARAVLLLQEGLA